MGVSAALVPELILKVNILGLIEEGIGVSMDTPHVALSATTTSGKQYSPDQRLGLDLLRLYWRTSVG